MMMTMTILFKWNLFMMNFSILNEHNKLLPIAILPEWWIEYGGENWLSEEDFQSFQKNR